MVQALTPELEYFNRMFETYINQFFGDLSVREIITEVYPSDTFRLAVEKNSEFDDHHYVEKLIGEGIEKICSVDDGYQNSNVDTNDNMCQSYSLLQYLQEPVDLNDKIGRQMAMITMYRRILASEEFLEKLKSIDPLPATKWRDFSNGIHRKKTFSRKGIKKMTREKFLANVLITLDMWEKFGFKFFIGKYDKHDPLLQVSSIDLLERKRKADEGIHPVDVSKQKTIGGKSQRYNLRKRRTTKKLR
jgi:hypothetical protein